MIVKTGVTGSLSNPPLLTYRMGAVSSVLDAETEGLDDAESRRVIYKEPQFYEHLQRQLTLLGPREMERRTGINVSRLSEVGRREVISKKLTEKYRRHLLRGGRNC